MHIVKLHVKEWLLVGDGSHPHIDAEKWCPLIINLPLFGIGSEVHPSRLAESDFMKFVSNATGPSPSSGGRLAHRDFGNARVLTPLGGRTDNPRCAEIRRH